MMISVFVSCDNTDSANEVSSEETVNMLFNSSTNLGQRPKKSKTPSVIDHIFYSKTGLTAKYYNVVVARYTYTYADHVPVLADFVLD